MITIREIPTARRKSVCVRVLIYYLELREIIITYNKIICFPPNIYNIILIKDF